MKFLGYTIFEKEKKQEHNNVLASSVKNRTYLDQSSGATVGISYPIITRKYDGEKTPGELGVIFKNELDYKALRLRAYDAEIKTDIVRIITSKFFKWVVGNGLKLQAEIQKDLLEAENITADWSKIQTQIESRFAIWSNSKMSDYSELLDLHQIAYQAKSAAFLGGDCLVIMRYIDGVLKCQLIDGEHICQPSYDFIKIAEENGNSIKHGVEVDARGRHIAFYVKQKSGEFERVLAKGEKSNRVLAWMVYGDKNRIDHVRGIPKIAQILEKVNKLERYTDASIGKAEQAANIVYAIKHSKDSTGENPLDDALLNKIGNTTENIDSFALGDGLANRITQTTSNQTYNLPPGSELASFGTNIETAFEPFYRAIFNTICASVDMPPEVALQMYNSNYSASRAAINGWGYIVDYYQIEFSKAFYKPIYKIWLETQILSSKISANGYLVALRKNDFMMIEAWSNARFVGKKMPHIDPLKEVKAVREMLEEMLISREQATEMLNVGDFHENFANLELENELYNLGKQPEQQINNNANANI